MSADLEINSMTVIELAKWLETKGIPVEFCIKFEGMFDG